MHASDERGDAEAALQVDGQHRMRGSVVAVAALQFLRELDGERGLAGVARAEERDVGLALEDQGDLLRESVHAHDLGWVVQRPAPYKGVYRHPVTVSLNHTILY